MAMVTKARVPAIDGIRGLAILAMVIVHVAYTTPILGREFIKAASVLRYGVDLFFALSGWVLCHNYFFRPEGERPSVGKMLVVRVIRLVPLYWLGILFFSVAPVFIYDGNWPDAGLMASNVALWNAWEHSTSGLIVPGGWTISVELWAGLVLLVVLPHLGTLRRAVIAWAVVVAVTRLLPVGGVGDTPWRHLPTFFAGVIAWHMHRRAEGEPAAYRGLAWVALVLSLVGYLTLHGAALGVWDRALQAGTASALFMFFAARFAWSSMPARGINVLGGISYPLYLVHFFMIEFCTRVIVGLAPWELSGLALYALVFAGTLILGVPVSLWIERQIDRPLREGLQRRWCSARTSPAGGNAAALR